MTREEIAAHCRHYKHTATYEAFWQAHHRCEACSEPSSAPHHARSRGAGGSDDPRNLLALCRWHHSEIHTIGNIEFALRYPQVASKIEAALALPAIVRSRV